MPLPDAFLDRLARIVPPERLDATRATFHEPQPVGFRVATLLADENATLDALRDAGLPVAPVDGVPGAYTVPADARAALLASAPAVAGHVYLQNMSSQLPPLVLLDAWAGAPDAEAEAVLDVCAAPGSKTGQLAALLGPDGAPVTAVEKARPRFYRLRANLAAQGAPWVETRLGPGEAAWRRAPEAFSHVLLDAPCSTEGRFRDDQPETTRYWSPRKVREMRGAQTRLLFGAVQALAPGGTLVYSTCTFAPEENEGVVAKALRTFGDALEVVDAGLPTEGPLGAQAVPGLPEWEGRAYPDAVSQHVRRVLPGGGLEAFFVARFVKHASTLRPRRD